MQSIVMEMFWKIYLQGVEEYCFVKILTDGDHHMALQVLASNTESPSLL